MQLYGNISRIVAVGLAAAIVSALLIASVRGDPPVASHTVYRCETAGVTTFSDRPCGPDARTYEADTGGFSTYKPVPVTVGADTETKRTRRPKRRAATAAAAARNRARHETDCERIEKSLRDIRSKMRAGYSAQEGERLRARYTKLRERRRSERCR